MGDVYMTLLLFFRDKAIAYYAIAVLPADVCAQTNTDSSDYIAFIAFLWKWSNLKGYFFAFNSPLYIVLSYPLG